MTRHVRGTLFAAIIGSLVHIQGVRAEVGYPSGTQNFESMAVGNSVDTLAGWVVVNSSAPANLFTVQGANTGGGRAGSGSTRWLKVNDTDAGAVQNRFYSPGVIAPVTEDYTWTFFAKLQSTPPGAGAAKPRFTIQHRNGAYANAWGIEFTSTGANLIVTGIGGPAASTPFYALTGSTGVGRWVKIRLRTEFSTNTVYASVNERPEVSLPISLTGDPKDFRFCYRGEDTGNAVQMLLDDVSVGVGEAQAVPTVSAWGLLVLALVLITGAKLRFGQRVRNCAA